jgi:prevent-host-death family protein
MQAGVAELKARLSTYLKQVKAGHELLVTERGVPIAKLVRLEAGERRRSRRARLGKAGVLRLGRGRLPKLLQSPPTGQRAAGRAVVNALLADRDEGR